MFDLVVSSRKRHCRTSWSASTSETAKERKIRELRISDDFKEVAQFNI